MQNNTEFRISICEEYMLTKFLLQMSAVNCTVLPYLARVVGQGGKRIN